MLSDEIVEKLSERLVERMNKTNLFVIKKIAKKIKELDNVVPSNAHDIIQIMEYGGDIDEIVEELSKQTNLSVKDIYDILEGVAKNDLRFAKKYYDYKKRKYIPWEENEVLRNQVDAIARQTIDKFLNLSKTTALGYTIKDRTGKVIFKDISSLYKDLIDEGIVSVSQGKTTLYEEMSRFIKQIGKSGLKTINYESGYSRRLDSAVRMNIQDGIRELHNQTERILGEQFGADGVEITVHGYPAPDHAEVQGRQFSYDEFDKLQETGIAKDVKGREINLHKREDGKTTSTYRPISEMNCYHYTFPIVVGVSRPEYTDEQLKKIREDNYKGFEYGGKHYTMYEGTQLQRKIETEIRKQKDIQRMGVEGNKKDVAEEAQRNIDNLVKEYYELSKESGLPTRLDRIQVEGYKEIPVSDEIKTEKVKREEISKESSKYKVLVDNDFKYMEKKTKEIYSNATSSEKSALNNYTLTGFEDINKYLAKKDENMSLYNYTTIGDVKKDIKNIDGIMDKSKIDENIIVYKGTTSKYFINALKNDDKEIKLPVYLSTSGKQSISENWLRKNGMRNLGYYPAMLEIKVPKNTCGLYLGDIFNENGINEFEVLLDRDLKYKINGYKLEKTMVDVMDKYGFNVIKQDEMEYVKIMLEVIK